ncbi:uncharacterized protein CANTADRAFT_228857 [Suhomyces tanzawaensis NRRL Y-17324]|uniref:Uncharacterized protein n=1 Tax=Suhomyces tanzawaensis NRRL Y-17324 TaxID=984487 RepID=A0A1E4SKY1_9ASCO|nr:uncharacterized protein CANTADRAFT_228857 [Suhomyces tanzawaensis NRRL Y-17324]ODV80161.1 hypothetical protein CANTADRAFT_228857 [Suhomyces tanzawaensis NRRL Y-17324]
MHRAQSHFGTNICLACSTNGMESKQEEQIFSEHLIHTGTSSSTIPSPIDPKSLELVFRQFSLGSASRSGRARPATNISTDKNDTTIP